MTTMTSFCKFVCICCCLLLVVVTVCNGQPQQQMQQMQQQMQLQKQHLEHNLQTNPRSAEAMFQYAWFRVTVEGSINSSSIQYLVDAFSSDKVDVPLPLLAPSSMAYAAAQLVGRYAFEMKEYDTSYTFLTVAHDLTTRKNENNAEVCVSLQLATALDPFPISVDAADTSIARVLEHGQALLQQLETTTDADADANASLQWNETWLSDTIPGYANDPYIHCIFTLFPLSFYYRANITAVTSQHYELTKLVYPKLLYTAPHVTAYEEEQNESPSSTCISTAETDTTTTDTSTSSSRKTKKIQLGIISATISEGHSVSEDFGGVLQRLNRDLFNVTYVNIHERSSPANSAQFLSVHSDVDTILHYSKDGSGDQRDGAWTIRISKDLASRTEWDIVLYLDMTMSSYIRRLGMSRLAPIQINTHGHPVTSGHDRSIIQYFISWAEAELPIDESSKHYTEELVLIPKGKLHQYYTPRIIRNADGRRLQSRMDHQYFDHLTKQDLLSTVLSSELLNDDTIHFYTCMQKPFKVFPEFDELLCGILQRDPDGHAILHKEEDSSANNHRRFVERFRTAGCDMHRVHFVSQQPPHRLLRLYAISTVVLDSYPAGGCTTTREALELGKSVVTWPARLLGGRWTLGLYNSIGLDDETKQHVIADSKEEYISKAVSLGTNTVLRQQVEQSIRDAIPNLFYRTEAVEEWEKILLRVSPVKFCDDNNNNNTNNNDEL